MMITRISPFTGISHTRDLPITQLQLDLWITGTPIHKAMPDLTASDREFIKTGITDDDNNGSRDHDQE